MKKRQRKHTICLDLGNFLLHGQVGGKYHRSLKKLKKVIFRRKSRIRAVFNFFILLWRPEKMDASGDEDKIDRNTNYLILYV